MSNLDISSLIILGIAGLGVISNNSTLTIAVIILLLLRLTNLNSWFPWIETYGLHVGILILTIGVMAPIASGKMPVEAIVASCLNWKWLLAVAVGIIAAVLGGRGVQLMGQSPTIVTGLAIGTVLGVALFRGVPVGPLIAAGILSLFIGKS